MNVPFFLFSIISVQLTDKYTHCMVPCIITSHNLIG